MFTCRYCNTTYPKFQTTCSSCGANLSTEGAAKLPMQGSAIERIRDICESYEDAKEFMPGDHIPERKMKNAKKVFEQFPADATIFLFCDTHPTEKGKRGFLICEDGLYWHNSWAVDTNRNFLTWEDFVKRELGLDRFTLTMGRGDAIGLAGLGSDQKRDKALRLLNEIKAALGG